MESDQWESHISIMYMYILLKHPLRGSSHHYSKLVDKFYCVVPEKIPTHPMEGHQKFLGGGGF